MKKIVSIITSVTLVMALLAALNLSVSASSGKTVSGTFNYNYAARVLDLVNEQRTQNGLSKLILTEDLTESAMLRAAEITVSFSHTRPNGDSCFTAFHYTAAAGENIAYGQSSPSAVMTSWMNSSGHRANILSANFTKMGVGCFVYNGTLYWVQVFSGGSGTSYTPSGTKAATVNVSLVSGVDSTVSYESSTAGTVDETTAKETTTEKETTTAKETTTEKETTTAKETTTEKETTTAAGTTAPAEDNATTAAQQTTAAQTTPATGAATTKPAAAGGTTAKETTMAASGCTTAATKPADTVISCITAAANAFTVNWCPQSGVCGYQIRYSTDCNMQNAVTVTVDSCSASSKTFSAPAASGTCYVQIRTYTTVGGQNYYSCWSAAQCVGN